MSRKKNLTENKIKSRAWSMFFIATLVYGLLLYRLVDIQVINYHEYKNKVDNQSTKKIDLNSGRGVIYDRNLKPITDSTKQQIIIVEKEKLIKDDNIQALIQKTTNMDTKELYKIIEEQLDSSMLEIKVDNLDKASKEALKKNGLIVEEKTLRYSSNQLLSHTIGYINKIDKVGKYGIERSMDKILSSSNEEYISAFKAGDSGNTKKINILEGSIKTIKDNEDSKHIKLTIDKNIQSMVENILNKEENPSSVIISDVDTGEILAMSSRPTFSLDKISTSDNGEFVNRTIQLTYPPGSVFKIVVLYAALENNIIDENYTYNCEGNVVVGKDNEILKCNNLEGHKLQTLQQSFSNSCNTAFYDIASKTGKENIIKAIKKLKLDSTIDIGLEEERNREIPNDIAIRNLAIGQDDIEFSPIQINQMTQIIANNGTYKPLFLYDSVIDKDKNLIKTFKSSKDDEIISPYTLTIIKEMMKDVSKEGTGKDLKDLEGGTGIKTGTAQSTIKGEKVNHGWVTGFYPEDKPKYAITVLIEGTPGNSKSALPVYKQICEKIK